MPIISYDSWVNEDTYMDEMAKLHKLNPKLDIIAVLKQEFDELHTKPDYRSDLPGEGKKWLLTECSAQIVALSLELTDDLAAVCWSYLETIACGDILFIQRLANWKLKQGHKFYNEVANNPTEAARAVGLDIASTPSAEQESIRQRFAWINDKRDKFWPYYQGYKHGQRATPIVLTMSKAGTTTAQEWGLYHIPQTFRRDPTNRTINSENQFINTVDNIAWFCKLATECVNLSNETKGRQYPKVFKHPLA